MNYKRVYNQIIENRKQNPIIEGYTEKHHIVPRSLGGSDDEYNLVRLSAREHFICHYLLVKIQKYKTKEYYKMLNAFIMMNCHSTDHQRYSNSKIYEYHRKDISEMMSLSQSGDKNSQYGKKWIYNIELEECKTINKEDKIPEGWNKGRIQDFTLYKLKEKEKEKKRVERKNRKIKEKENKERIDKLKKDGYHLSFNERKIEAEKYYEMFMNGDYSSLREFHRKNDIKKSVMFLSKAFRNFIPEYKNNSDSNKRYKH